MATHSLRLLLAVVLPYLIIAIQVTPNSPCASKCIDSSSLDESDSRASNTVASDIVCDDVDFTGTSNGTKWKQCMTCLQDSTYEYGGESDQYWFVYNLRYSFDYCVFGLPSGAGEGSNPCVIPSACGPLKTALEYGNLSTSSTEFGYCDADGGSVTGEYYEACLECVTSSGDTQYVGNALVGLEAGCKQRPGATSILGLSETVFSTSIIKIVNPATLEDSSGSVLSTGAIAGIVIGGIVFILIVAACIFIRRRKRQNRARRGLDEPPRWGMTHKTHKRKSSFSFRCRNILASPISPKFFRDDPTPAQGGQQYGSLNEMAATQVSGVTGDEQSTGKRYFIESKTKAPRPAYEPAWSPQQAPPTFQSFSPPPEVDEEKRDQQVNTATPESRTKPQRPAYEPAWSPQYAPQNFQSFGSPPEAVGEESVRQGNTATPESKPKPQRPAYEPAWCPQYAPPTFQSFGPPPEVAEEDHHRQGNTASPGKTEKASLNINTTLVPPQPAHQSPKGDAFSVLKSISHPSPPTQPFRSASYPSLNSRATASSPSQGPNSKPIGKTTTISSQGTGYPTASPSIKQKSGWPSPREDMDGWLPPPPPPGTLKSSSSSLKYGRKSSAGSMKRMRRESGSPVETKQIQVSFPAPPPQK